MDQHLQGKTGYHRLQERCVFVLPSGNSLRKKVQQQCVSDGDGIDLYERIMMHMNTDEIIGQIMCDEMKLKGDIAMCVHSNQLRGFTKDFADSKKIINSLMESRTYDKSFSEPATYVNQWRYRTINGKHSMLNFGLIQDH